MREEETGESHPYGQPLGAVATMASKSGVWVFYYLQGEDGDSVDNPNAFNVRETKREGEKREFPRWVACVPAAVRWSACWCAVAAQQARAKR